MTQEEQIAAVTQNGYAIEYISSPSEAVQLAAVTKNGYAIHFIEKPSEAVQMVAVTQDGHAIEYIENPSEAVQIAALKWGVYTSKIKASTIIKRLQAIEYDYHCIASFFEMLEHGDFTLVGIL